MRVSAVVVMVMGLVRVASAEEVYPRRYIDRPLVLPATMLALHGVLRINLSTDKVGSPMWIAPSVSYGVRSKLEVGIVHDPGLCLFGEHDFLGTTVDECVGGVYDDFAVDGKYMLVDRPDKHIVVAGHATLGAASFDPILVYLRAGVLARYTLANRAALIADWGLRFGLSNREEGMGNKEAFDLPLQFVAQATESSMIFVEAGLLAPFSNMTDTYYLSFGWGVVYAASSALDVGARFELPRLAGGKATGTNASTDVRQLDLFVTYRL